MDKELHLIILWERARYQEAQIMEDIQRQFRLQACYEVTWTDTLVASNFSRFYGVNLPDKSEKERECGKGPFLLLLVWDDQPVYETRETSHGQEVVNVHLFDAKTRYRQWTKYGHKVHATNNTKETDHDLILLLGQSYDDYLKSHPETTWDGHPAPLIRNISGAQGWKSLREFFYVFNHTVDYVVLRGEENLTPQKDRQHQDVDLLVREWQNALFVMNGRELWHFPPYRPKMLVSTKEDGDVVFDVWMSTLGYYDAAWCRDMFATREYTGLFYRLNAVNAFYARLYHTLVRKRTVAADYLPWFQAQFVQLGLERSSHPEADDYPMDFYYTILQDFMDEKGYAYTNAPEDWHCYYKSRIARIKPAWEALKRRTDLQAVVPFRVEDDTESGYLYFKGRYQDRPVFIKYGGRGDSCANEIRFSKRLSAHDPSHFMTPVVCDPQVPFVAYDLVEGTPLTDFLQSATPELRQSMERQLTTIADALAICQVMHRDLCPRNLLVVGETLMLIDFQYAVDALHPQELVCVKSDRLLALQIGENYRYRQFAWNDARSMEKVVQELGLSVSVPKALDQTFWMPLKWILLSIVRHQASLLVSRFRKVRSEAS